MSWPVPCSITSSRLGLWSGRMAHSAAHSGEAGGTTVVGREEVDSALDATGGGGGGADSKGSSTGFLSMNNMYKSCDCMLETCSSNQKPPCYTSGAHKD